MVDIEREEGKKQNTQQSSSFPLLLRPVEVIPPVRGKGEYPANAVSVGSQWPSQNVHLSQSWCDSCVQACASAARARLLHPCTCGDQGCLPHSVLRKHMHMYCNMTSSLGRLC